MERKSFDAYGVQMHRDGNGWTCRAAIPAANASGVELCFYEHADSLTECRFALSQDRGVWRAEIPGLTPGLFYGLRVHGPFEPQKGHRFNSAKLLVDPWARAITGEPRHDPSLYGYKPGQDPGRSFSSTDSAAAMPRCVTIDPSFDWQGVTSPQTPWRDTLIYECHVRGFTMRHPEVEPQHRGTYLGLASPPVIEHLQKLGVTAVELLPCHQIAREPHLHEKGLANYWGYSTLGYFAPHAGYCTAGRDGGISSGEQVREWKTMVRELHRAGIEVILDVVYNHTAEAGFDGPTLSLRGLDNQGYYRLPQRNRRRYIDVTGCGNTLDTSRRPGRELVLGSLRYWVREMGVDGFRFDLAPTLGRDERGQFDTYAALFQAIAQDPVLADVKWTAEPWDVGPGGYRLGGMPNGWPEWNDRYRDTVRTFWRGDNGGHELVQRISGSPDIFPNKGSLGSVSFVACHDGYTLRDLTSYEAKHNAANLENNRDGHNHNLGCNWGVEGETSDSRILAARRRHRRNVLTTLYCSRGVPMISHGDELGRTQGGNNNAYCQDNETSWVDWSVLGPDGDADEKAWLAFVQRLGRLRRDLPGLASDGEPPIATSAAGHDLPPGDIHTLALRYPRKNGEELLLLLNGCGVSVPFDLPDGAPWHEFLETVSEPAENEPVEIPASQLVVEPFSLHLLRRNVNDC